MTATTTLSPAQERLAHRNYRYQYAKKCADTTNALFLEFSKIAGTELSAEQVRDLLYVAESFVLANNSADRSYDLYSEYCERHNYKERTISYLYPYSTSNY